MMTETKIRTLLFSIGSTVAWLFLTYQAAFGEISTGDKILIGLVALLLMIAAMGQGEK